jgi:phosphotriesterase-related protein
MRRRQFIKNITLASTLTMGGVAVAGQQGKGKFHGKVMTVTGPIVPERLGFTLTHEHILVDFIGAEKIKPGRYDPKVVADRAIPHLKELKSLGVGGFVECTPAYLGRDPELMRTISKATGVKILTNTGYYNAQNGKFVPKFVEKMTPDQLAEIWIAEWKKGIGDTGIRPGFIKISVNKGDINEQDRKIVRAAAITHRETGLRIHSHTGRTPVSGYQQIEIMKEEGVSPGAWVWVHATGMDPLEDLRAAFEDGAWISYDNLRPDEKSVQRMIRCIDFARTNNYLDQVLLSHDAGWYVPDKPGGGEHRPYTAYFTHFLPAARKAGITQAELDLISIGNPSRAFAIRKCLL